MILYDLQCRSEHLFEAWFKDSATYQSQIAAREVSCPVCGDTKLEKALMAPRVSTGGIGGEGIARYAAALREMRRQVEGNCDYVGERFPEEARRIHHGEAESRGIYGEASDQEAKALEAEGVEFERIPWAPREDA